MEEAALVTDPKHARAATVRPRAGNDDDASCRLGRDRLSPLPLDRFLLDATGGRVHHLSVRARRLAAGCGFTFCPGVLPTYGTTTPLWTLLLGALARLGAPPHLAAPWLTSLLHAAGAVLLYLVLAHLGRPKMGLLVGLLWATALAVFFRTGGMETALLVALMGLSVLLLLRGASWWLGIVTGALVLTAPDAALFALAVLLAAGLPMARAWRRGLKVLLAAGVTYLPWALYAHRTFGSVIPLSLRAKLAGDHAHVVSFFAFVDQFSPGPLGAAILLIATALLLLGAYRLWRERPEMLALVVWIPAYYGALWLGKAPEFAWYYVPPLWLCLLLVGVGASELVDLNQRLKTKGQGKNKRAAPVPPPAAVR